MTLKNLIYTSCIVNTQPIELQAAEIGMVSQRL